MAEKLLSHTQRVRANKARRRSVDTAQEKANRVNHYDQAAFDAYIKSDEGRRDLAAVVEMLIGDTQPDPDMLRRLVGHARDHLRNRFSKGPTI